MTQSHPRRHVEPLGHSIAIQAIATTYTVNLGEDWHEWITVELTAKAGMGPHKPERDTWAVRKRGWVLNGEMEWEYEPIPSSRDDDFMARTRWTLSEALEHAVYMAQREASWRRDAR